MAASYARAGQITVTTAGTRVQGPDVPGSRFVLAAVDPSDIIWVGDATTSATVGYPLRGTAPGNSLEIDVANLSLLWFDASANGDKVSWIRIR